SWERGRYYTRSRKVNGRVVREYVGAGRVAELTAQLDAIERQERADKRADWLARWADLETLDDSLDHLNELADLLARAALVVAGFHQHKRGEWRRRPSS